MPLPPFQISCYRFSLLAETAALFGVASACLGLFAPIIAWDYCVGVCATKTMVLHLQYDDSAVYAAFPWRFTPETTSSTLD